ncbi:MAG: hypothetical protein ACJ786_02635 [Catenulispora sp.]
MRNPKLRAAAVILGLPLAVVVGVVAGTLMDDGGSPWEATLLVILAPVVAYGWNANRWWVVFPLPLFVGGTYLVVLRIIDLKTGGCSICGEDEDWSNYPYWFIFTTLLPVTFILAVAVGARRARDEARRARVRRQVI